MASSSQLASPSNTKRPTHRRWRTQGDSVVQNANAFHRAHRSVFLEKYTPQGVGPHHKKPSTVFITSMRNSNPSRAATSCVLPLFDTTPAPTTSPRTTSSRSPSPRNSALTCWSLGRINPSPSRYKFSNPKGVYASSQQPCPVRLFLPQEPQSRNRGHQLVSECSVERANSDLMSCSSAFPAIQAWLAVSTLFSAQPLKPRNTHASIDVKSSVQPRPFVVLRLHHLSCPPAPPARPLREGKPQRTANTGFPGSRAVMAALM